MSSFLDPDDWPEAVVILSKDPWSVAGYAPKLQPVQGTDPHLVTWREAHHERSFPLVELLEQSAEVFDFATTGGVRYRLLPLTLELYEKHVKRRTLGRPSFGSMAELLSAMRFEW